MLTIKQITENTEEVIRGLEKKHFKDAKATIEQVLAFNDKRRSTQNQLDKNLAEVNSLSKSIGQLMKEGKKEDAETAKARVAEIKETSKALQAEMDKAQEDMTNLLYTIPNVPYDSVPEGVSAEDNVVEKMGGMETELPKNALPHWELAKKYDLIDFDLGVKITGAGFPVYKGKGARLQRALINFFLDEARASGYEEIMPPTVVNTASGYGTGQLPDKEGQMYHCEVDDLYLIPTAEVPVTNIYRDVILDEKQLPIKNCAYTQCFRREAGSYGKDVRGLNRLHEFSKVELVRIDKPLCPTLLNKSFCSFGISITNHCALFIPHAHSLTVFFHGCPPRIDLFSIFVFDYGCLPRIQLYCNELPEISQGLPDKKLRPLIPLARKLLPGRSRKLFRKLFGFLFR